MSMSASAPMAFSTKSKPQTNSKGRFMIEDALKAMILENTKSPIYQNAAIAVMKQNLKRGLIPQIKTLTCDRCRQLSKVVRWTLEDKIADSWGYMEFEDESVCYKCLKEAWLGPIIMPKAK